jgi:hypothetical protein
MKTKNRRSLALAALSLIAVYLSGCGTTGTSKGAYAVGYEDRIGSIEEGKQADMIILDRNLLEIDPTTIKDTQVLTTVMNGDVVFNQTD